MRASGGVRMERQREYEPIFFAVEVVCEGERVSRCTFSSTVQLDRKRRTLTEVRFPELEGHIGVHIAMRSVRSLLAPRREQESEAGRRIAEIRRRDKSVILSSKDQKRGRLFLNKHVRWYVIKIPAVELQSKLRKR